ncbi:MAG: phosphoglycerate mutase family protein [Candidatus Nanohaloarchaeota archaeon QJJ-5]|nr:phosphoglycerate mutase family protein [Candidatus Nanohaloarchaeota archaeon QJJ-5]
MTDCTFLRHFETRVEPDRPVSEWVLSDAGHAAMKEYVADRSFDRFGHILTSPEPKAEVAGRKIAEESGLPLMVVDDLAEVDRSGEGFIDSETQYEEMVEAYLTADTVPFEWENRTAVEQRWRSFIKWADAVDGPILAVTHGMFLSSVIPRMRGNDPVQFWQELGFGEEIAVDLNEVMMFLE